MAYGTRDATYFFGEVFQNTNHRQPLYPKTLRFEDFVAFPQQVDQSCS